MPKREKCTFSDLTIKEMALQRCKTYNKEIGSSDLKMATDKLDDMDDLQTTNEIDMAIVRG